MPFKLEPESATGLSDDNKKTIWHLSIEPNGDPSAKGHQAPSIGVWLNKDPSKSVAEIVHRIYPHQNAGRTMFELSEQAQRWATGFQKGVAVSNPDVDLHVIGRSLKWDQEIAPPALSTQETKITVDALRAALQPLEWTRMRDANGKPFDDAYEAQTGGTVYQYEKVDDYWSIFVDDPKGGGSKTLYRVDYLANEDAAIQAVDAHRVSIMADQLGLSMPVEPAPSLKATTPAPRPSPSP